MGPGASLRPVLHRSRPRTVLAVALVGVAALLPAACAGDSGETGGPTPLPSVKASDYADQTGKAEVKVVALDNTFRPQYVKVSPGTKVVFTNQGRNAHNVISVNEGQFTDLPTDKFQSGDEGTVTAPDEPGEVPYYCSLHGTPRAGMNGRILVVADS